MNRKIWVPLQEKLKARPFNFEALKSEQILTLGRAILDGFYEGPFYEVRTKALRDRGGSLQNHFAVAMGRLAASEPRKAKPLLKAAALSELALDNIVAAHCAPELGYHDLPLATDIVTYVKFAHGVQSRAGSIATDKMERMMPESYHDLWMAQNKMGWAALDGEPRPVPPSLLS